MGCRHNLHFADIYGFRGCETLWAEMGSFNYAALASFAKLFGKYLKVYDRDSRLNSTSFGTNFSSQK